MSKKKKAEIRHVVDDSGQFGFSYCSNCNKDPFKHGDGGARLIPKECLHCGYALVWTTKVDDFGGSDF